MNRIDSKFRQLRRQRKKAFIACVTAGDPSLKLTQEFVVAFEQAGADIIELCVPFSDPIADGPTIQAASQRALKYHTTLEKILGCVRAIRRRSEVPVALMSYYNPIFHMGEKAFVAKAKKAGVDGLIIPDLPPEEASHLRRLARQAGIITVFFIAPTTKPTRMKKIAAASSGFIYYVSLTGVTGARKSLPDSIKKQIRLAKRITRKPICVGFGISSHRQVKEVGAVSDGVIVASAIINQIQQNKGKKGLVKRVARFVKRLKG